MIAKIEELKDYIIKTSAPREEINVMLMMIREIRKEAGKISEHLATRIAIEESREPNHAA